MKIIQMAKNTIVTRFTEKTAQNVYVTILFMEVFMIHLLEKK